jgi:capsular polysaccharide biosynthesis protein
MNEERTMETERDAMTLKDLAGILRRRKWLLLLPALGVFALSAVVAFVIPATYKSTTTILIEEQGIPREYVTANITSFADQRLQSINQRIMSTTKLLDLITRFRLYEDLKAAHTIDEIVGKMRQKDIVFNTISADVIDPRTGRPGQATIAFSVSYKGRNPETVQRVANELASLYLEENLKTREKASADTSKFMEDERADVKAKMAALDAKIAVYKQKHGDSLPELAQVNLQGLDQVEREMSRMEDQLRALKERESNLEQELASVSPDTTNQRHGARRREAGRGHRAPGAARLPGDADPARGDEGPLRGPVHLLRRPPGPVRRGRDLLRSPGGPHPVRRPGGQIVDGEREQGAGDAAEGEDPWDRAEPPGRRRRHQVLLLTLRRRFRNIHGFNGKGLRDRP